MNKKKYTIVFPHVMLIGCHRNYIPKLDYVELTTDELKDTLREKYENDVYFVFDGWVKQTED